MSPEKHEQTKPQGASTAQKVDLSSAKDLIAQADGDLSVSEKEAIAIKFLDSKAYSQLSSEEKARWVNEILFVLKKFSIEKKEVQSFCEIALKKIKNEVLSGSEFFNDIADIARDHCATLKKTGYSPTETKDIKMVAGYFRHITKDAGQRQKYIAYLNANPTERALFLGYISDRDNLVNYYLKTNREEGVIRSMDNFVAELGAAMSQQIKGSIITELTRKTKNTSEIFSLFSKFENLSGPDFSAFENQLLTNPELTVEFLETWGIDSPAKKALLKEKPQLYERLEGLFLKLSKKFEIHAIDKKNKQETIDRLKFQSAKEKEVSQTIDEYRTRLSTKSQVLFKALSSHTLLNDKTTDVVKLQQEIRAIAEEPRLRDAAKYSTTGSENRKNAEAIYHAINTLAYKLEVKNFNTKNYESEIKAKQAIVEAALLRGEIVLNAFSAEQGNMTINVEKIESDIRNKDIKDINSAGFAAYIQSLHSTGKLNKHYLIQDGNIGRKKLWEIALHWGIDDSVGGKELTLAQKALKDTNIGAYNVFKNILTTALRERSELMKFDEAKGFPRIAAYLVSHEHRPRFTPEEAADVIRRLDKESILPLLIEITGKKWWTKAEILNFVSYLESDQTDSKSALKMQLASKNFSVHDKVSKFKLHGAKLTQNERKFLRSIESQEVQDVSEKDWAKLMKIIENIGAHDPKLMNTVELLKKIRNIEPKLADSTTIRESDTTQKKIETAGKKTHEEAKKKGIEADTPEYSKIATKNGAEAQKILDESRPAAIKAQRAKEEILQDMEKPLADGEKPLKEWLDKLGFGKYTVEEILRNESLRYAVLMRIGKMSEPIPSEVRAFQLKLAELVKADLARRTADETINTYHTDNGSWMQASIADGSIAASSVAANDTRTGRSREKTTSEITSGDTPINNYRGSWLASNVVGYSDIGGNLENLPVNRPVVLDNNQNYIVVRRTDGSIDLRANSPEIIKIPASEANIALSIVEVSKKLGELDMIRTIKPMIQIMREHHLFTELNNGMNSQEELLLMKHLVSVYGIEWVDLHTTDPESLAKSIRINTMRSENSFTNRGIERGFIQPDGRLRYQEFSQIFVQNKNTSSARQI